MTDLNDGGAFPPTQRHPEALVSDGTDGNLLEPSLSGAQMMAEFHRQVQAMIDAEDPSAHEPRLSRRSPFA